MDKDAAEGICLDLNRLSEIEADSGKDRKLLVFKTAQYYASLGWPILPVSYLSKMLPGDKVMKQRGYQKSFKYADASTNPDLIHEWFHPDDGKFAGFNIALVCGSVVSAVDLDIDAEGNGYDNFVESFGQLPDLSPAQKTPSGGYHFLFQHEPGFRTTTGIIKKVDVRGSTQDNKPSSHIVVYPSIIEVDGKPIMYRWNRGGPLPQLPRKLHGMLNKVVELKTKQKGRGNENVLEDDWIAEQASLEEVASAFTFLGSDSYDDWIKIGMAVNQSFPDDDGFSVWHEWSRVVPGYKDEADCHLHWKSFDPERPGGLTLGTVFFRARKNGYRRKGQITKELDDELRRDKNGKATNTNHNLDVALRSRDFAERFGGPLRWDKFKQEVTAGKRRFINFDYVDISKWFSTTFWIERASEGLRPICINIANHSEFDSLMEWADSLKWDGVSRLDGLCAAMRVSTDYGRAAVRRWLIGGMARAYQPGCSSTHMLVIHGDQGVGKSRFFRAISPREEWFSDSTHFKFSGNSSIRDEESKLAGRWIVEVAEFEGHYRSESTAIKNFITTQVPLVVKKYEPDATHMPRRCIFGASTNTDQLFNDPSGGRRFAVISIGGQQIDVAWVEENCEQIWAEARKMYQEGEKWWFDEGEMALQTASNRNYVVVHPWRDIVLQFVKDKSRFTSDDIFSIVIKIPLDRRRQQDSIALNQIMIEAGFKHNSTKVGGVLASSRLWHNPDPAIDNKWKGKQWQLPLELRDADKEEY